jgi:hypothetical protein
MARLREVPNCISAGQVAHFSVRPNEGRTLSFVGDSVDQTCGIQQRCCSAFILVKYKTNFHKLRCKERKLSLSRHGHSVTWQYEYYQVFMFAEEEHSTMTESECTRQRQGRTRTGRGGRKGRMWRSPETLTMFAGLTSRGRVR